MYIHINNITNYHVMSDDHVPCDNVSMNKRDIL